MIRYLCYRRSRSRTRSRTPKAYRRGGSRSRSRTPVRRSNKDKYSRHGRRHRGRSPSSPSRSPSSERYYRSKKNSVVSRRYRSRSESRSRSRSPVARSNFGSRKSGNSYNSGLNSTVNGRTKLSRNKEKR